MGPLGGGNSKIFHFHPENLGKMIQFDGAHIFQRGWFNHQLVMCYLCVCVFLGIDKNTNILLKLPDFFQLLGKELL